jgi:lipoprotein-releasing system permease protein
MRQPNSRIAQPEIADWRTSNYGGKAYILWISWRNMVRRSKRTGLSIMTYISILGVAIGVAALIIVLSVMGGFEEDLQAKMLKGQPHLEIMSEKVALGLPLTQYPLAMFEEQFPEATFIEPFTQSDVVLKQRNHMTSATMFGVDPQREGHLWGFADAVIEGEMDGIGRNHLSATSWDVEVRRPGILLGDQLAIQLGADLGDEITVLSPHGGIESALGGGTITRSYVVAGKFRTQMFNYDAKWAVVSLAEGRKFMADYDSSLDEDEYVSGVALNFADPWQVPLYALRAAGMFKSSAKPDSAPLKALTWQTVNKSLLFALKLEKFAMGSILMLIVIVAAFSISGTMMMTVFHKRGQVSLLRSLGMTTKDIARLYITHGFTIGSVGIVMGLVLGLGVCLLIKSFPVIPLPAGVYHLKTLPCKWLWFDYLVICGSAWIFSLFAAAYPAVTAARQDPGTGLRYL